MISIVIWQACDPFADAAQYFGERWRLPGSVRGATLDAIASSLPELFTGLFFVLLAAGVGDQASADGETEGLGATIATCAGSAVYNMMLIPALCGIVIARTRHQKPVIEVESKVISRDGLWFLACELVLIVFLFQPAMSWGMAATLLLMYVAYVYMLVLDSRSYRIARDAVVDRFTDEHVPSTDELVDALNAAGIKPSLQLINQVRRELVAGAIVGDPVHDEDGDEDDTAGILFGRFEVKLTPVVGYSILAVSTVIAAAACYWLVEVTQSTATTLNVPLFFVAVIVAAAASSVPDTFLSIAAARRGDDDGAVSNAFGSNIFDICICLSVPLLVSVYLNGGKPVPLTIDGQPMAGLFGLQILLCASTIVTLLIMWQDLRLTLTKSWILVGLYGIFVAYAVAGSLGILNL
ncbi:sodium:calcium antiporter [Stieleria varia]|uniref:Putative calcium/sodium:proton antiporter n=2 Tax=Stieleria varia TaxID=2528005 RepID=A0A5C6B848_9BACT|nr:hypothetical protein [Stieleria varia]TWU07611.1 putative calcium/sodium:proton antiporter [Stieleria varia]